MQMKISGCYIQLPKVKYILILSAVWSLSFLAGAQFAIHSIHIITPLLAPCIVSFPSIASQAVFLLLFLLLVTIAFLMNARWISFLIISINAFIISFCAISILLFCNSGGWLLCIFHLFLSFCFAGLLLWFTGRQFVGNKSNIKKDFSICFFALILCCLFDGFLLSPFIYSLIPIL